MFLIKEKKKDRLYTAPFPVPEKLVLLYQQKSAAVYCAQAKRILFMDKFQSKNKNSPLPKFKKISAWEIFLWIIFAFEIC